MTYKSISLPDEVVERCLANGRMLKAAVDKMIEVTVIQWERNDWGKFEEEFGRELFYIQAKINPQSDIDDEGYVTQAWFCMDNICETQEIDGETWALMKPSRFSIPDPVVYFRTSVAGNVERLLPHPDF